jgi:Holliday junction resolvasome RuvABC endonuclease subunit
MKVIKTLKAKNLGPATIMGIDSSTKSIAMSLYHRGDDLRLSHLGKISLDDCKTMGDKIKRINLTLPTYFEKYKPDIVRIERTIYIQSPLTSRMLSYIVGAIWLKSSEFCDNVEDVDIMTWKSHIGYKKVSKAEITQWAKEMGEKDAKKKAAEERKERTKKLLIPKIEGISEINDYDMLDAAAIGLWAAENET